MVNIISDYKDKAGRDFHEVDQILGTDDATVAGRLVLNRLRSSGYTPTALLQVFGNFSINDLQRMADNQVPCACRVIYINPAHLAEFVNDLRG